MNKIHLLDESTASCIAAGEVIERPAGVLKELVENALDAGATTVSVEIEGAGKKLIRVNDNGTGMSEDDLKMALLRHSTSKINSFDDLDTLNTFGFRGEALYSVAAVSEVSIISSTGETGAKISARAGADLLLTPAPAIKGTTVEVRNLFFNVPARLKFLKSDSYEKACLLKVIEEAALANPEVNFNIKIDAKQIYSLKGDIKERLTEILGPAVADSLVYIESGNYNFKAYLTPPDKLVPGRDSQYAFINKRPISSKTLQQAVYKAYQGARANNKHPVYVIYMTMPSADFDVNIHPQKKDVRFVRESQVFSFIMHVISKRLFNEAVIVQSEIKPNIIQADFLSAPLETLAEKAEEQSAPAEAVLEQREVEFHTPGQKATFMVKDFEEREPYYANLEREAKAPAKKQAIPARGAWWRGPYRYLGALHKTYLLYENEYGLTLLDQHAARERVLYEKYMAEFDAAVEVQPLLVPVQIDMSASSVENLMLWKDWLAGAGFEVERFSPRSVVVNTVPNLLRIKEKEIKAFIISLSQILGDPLKSTDGLKKKTVAMLACKKSIKAKETLSAAEAVELIESLKDCEDGLHCPHGRPVLIEISITEIARKLGR